MNGEKEDNFIIAADNGGVRGELLSPKRYPDRLEYKVRAKRTIITEFGRLDKGEIGYVPAQWVERLKRNRCGCGATINSIEFI